MRTGLTLFNINIPETNKTTNPFFSLQTPVNFRKMVKSKKTKGSSRHLPIKTLDDMPITTQGSGMVTPKEKGITTPPEVTSSPASDYGNEPSTRANIVDNDLV